MKALLNLSLLVTVSLLAVHEMDAMTHAEWRLLPGLSALDNATGRDVFVLLHIPLYVGLFWALFYATWKQRAGQIVSVLVIVHAIVHFLLSDHRLYTFSAPIETITVYGAAVSALAYFGLSLRMKSE
ncbi:MAG: DUF6713 family protein [Pseudomonadota bacterium]